MKVLIAEDDGVSRKILSRTLEKWGYEVIVAEDGDCAWSVLERDDSPNLAILDWEMPGRDGVEVCRQVRQLQREAYTYILLLTARTDQEDIINGLQAGADDYITKPFNKHELEVRLRAGKRIVELQHKLIEAREVQRVMAMHDPLTKLLNRGAILERLRAELARARRSPSHVAVILGDLDNFKIVNDTYGHLAGDEVLREVSRRFKSSARSYDSVGRYGGEEFLIVVPGCPQPAAMKQAERLHEVIRSKPIRFEGLEIGTTISMGLAMYDGSVTPDEEKLVQSADEALYRAKQQGRDRIEIGAPLGADSSSSGQPRIAHSA